MESLWNLYEITSHLLFDMWKCMLRSMDIFDLKLKRPLSGRSQELLKLRWKRAAQSQNFGDHYANRSKAHWLRAKNLVHKSFWDARNMKDFRLAPLRTD